MVSFSCEQCGDVLTKKKLDSHRNQCRYANYTCLDCMVHFRTPAEWKGHTSCMTEAQKYQGALYKEKANSKQKRTSASTTKPSTPRGPKPAYVEDAPEEHQEPENNTDLLEYNPDATPEPTSDTSAPPPPPTMPAVPPTPPIEIVETLAPPQVNVFDFLVTGKDTPNTSRVNLAAAAPKPKHTEIVEPKAQAVDPDAMQIDSQPTLIHISRSPIIREIVPRESHRRSLIEPTSRPSQKARPKSYIEPKSNTHLTVDPPQTIQKPSSKRQSYQGPAPKPLSIHQQVEPPQHPHLQPLSSAPSTSQKRKRQVEGLNISLARHTSQELDDMIVDSSAHAGLHTGLTGGLQKLLSRSTKFPLSPEYSGGDATTTESAADILSPKKKPRQITVGPIHEEIAPRPRGKLERAERDAQAQIEADKERGRSTSAALVRVKKVRKASDESRPRKHQRASKRGDSVETGITGGGYSSRWSIYGREDSPRRERPHHGDRERERDGKKALKSIEYNVARGSREGSEMQQGQVVRREKDSRPRNDGAVAKAPPPPPPRGDQVVLYRSRAELFLSLVNKGPESESGCSVNKALKRFHRERGVGKDGGRSGVGSGVGKSGRGGESREDREFRGREREREKWEEEKALWREVRLRRNERGEVVVLFGGDGGD